MKHEFESMQQKIVQRKDEQKKTISVRKNLLSSADGSSSTLFDFMKILAR